YKKCLKNKEILLVSLVFMAGAAGHGQDINEVYIIPHFVHDFHLDITYGAFLFTFIQVGSLCGPFVWGWVSDRFDRKLVIQMSLLVSALSTLWLAWQEAISASLFVNLVIYGASVTSRQTLTQALLSDLVGEELFDASFSVAFLASLLIHGATTLLIPTLINYSPNSLQQHFIPIALIELPQVAQKEETPSEVKKSLPHIQRKVEKPVSKNEIIPTPHSAPPTAAVEPTNPMEGKTDVTPNPENTPSFAPTAPVEGGGSEAGAGKGVVGVVAGSGTAGEGGATAASGLGRGSGAAGLPAPTTV